jgi:hypothetical protein
MTAILPVGKLFLSVRGASHLSSPRPIIALVYEADSLKRRDRIHAYFPEGDELKDIKLFHGFQKRPAGSPRRQALDGPAVYEFKIAQSLPDHWAAWFDGLELTRDAHGNTLLSGAAIDQAALHGVLTKIRDLNLILLSVMRK